MGANMVCFWKWGHDWKPASAEQVREVSEKLGLFGIHIEKMDICSKCKKIRVLATTFLDVTPRERILPPYPFDEKQNS